MYLIQENNLKTRILYVSELFPEVMEKMIQENTAWDIDVFRIKRFLPPTVEELRVLRTEAEPARMYLDRKSKRRMYYYGKSFIDRTNP